MTIGWIAITFGANIEEPNKTDPNFFGDFWTVPLAPPVG